MDKIIVRRIIMPSWEYIMFSKTLQPKGVVGSRTTAMQLWDNKFMDSDGVTAMDMISEYGRDGWELVCVTPISASSPYPGRTDEIMFTFKRPLAE
jgi:hypothetical protein